MNNLSKKLFIVNEIQSIIRKQTVTSELVVDVQPKEVSIALLEDKSWWNFKAKEEIFPFLWAICI